MAKNSIVLVTGATGFVGNALIDRLLEESNFRVRAATRRSLDSHRTGIEVMQVGELFPDTDWKQALSDVEFVLHAAARVHVMRDNTANPLEEFRQVNADGTIKLAQQAARLGVKRFVYLSSIKVNGEWTLPGQPFTAVDEPFPKDPCAISKCEAEQKLIVLGQETDMRVVIIRPPLVYGPGVKANFYDMMRWLDKGIPLPFGAIHNKRSLVALDNLVDLIITCIKHPAAVNQTFLVSDGEDLSTTELLRRMAAALGKPARLLPVPQVLLDFGLTMLGKQDLARRLCGSL